MSIDKDLLDRLMESRSPGGLLVSASALPYAARLDAFEKLRG